MSHYPAFLRSHHAKTIGNASSTNNENDENSSVKNLIAKHMAKAQQSSAFNSNGNTATMRGILGEVGNMTLNNKPMITKPKIIQQQSNLIATIIEPLPTTNVTNRIEDIELGSDGKIPAEFDCDSGDLNNITTASEFVVDICKYWRELEEHTPIRQNFLLHRREGRGEKCFSSSDPT